jgi:hypothetical protein
MSNTNGVGNNPIGAPQALGNYNLGPGISPDALMVYCETRMRGLNEQMDGFFKKQQVGNKNSAKINEALEALNNNAAGTSPDNCAAQNKVMVEKLNDARDLAHTTGDFSTEAALQKVIEDFRGKIGQYPGSPKECAISKELMGGVIESVKNINSQINANSELNMINLQSVMSQRQTAIQMTTNLVQSLGEQSKMIAANVGK